MAANPEFPDQPFDDASGEPDPEWEAFHDTGNDRLRNREVGTVVVVLLWDALTSAQQAALLRLTGELDADGPARMMHLHSRYAPPASPGNPAANEQQPATPTDGSPFVPKQNRPTFDDGASDQPPAA